MRWRPDPATRRPDPEPLRSDDRRVVLVGTAAWAVLLLLAGVARSTLVAQGRGWWLWTPVAGVLLGLYGLRAIRRRR
jgi:Protein of unknown function (DUF2530)